MGTTISKAYNGLRHDHASSAPDPIDAATATAITAAVNEQQLAHLLPPLLAELHEENADLGRPTSLLDLDCEAGHNTLILAHLTRHWRVPVQLEGWERDKEKLELAKACCKDVQWDDTNSSVTFTRTNHWRRLQVGHPGLTYFRHMYEFVLSTLVMHRMPLDAFFKGIEGLLSRDSVALMTCVHPEFGVAENGLTGSEDEKGRVMEEARFTHSVQEVLEAAARCGLTVQGAVEEVKLSTEVIERFEHGLREDATKWVGRKVWFSVVLKRVVDDTVTF